MRRDTEAPQAAESQDAVRARRSMAAVTAQYIQDLTRADTQLSAPAAC
jgi:hypothetical protein